MQYDTRLYSASQSVPTTHSLPHQLHHKLASSSQMVNMGACVNFAKLTHDVANNNYNNELLNKQQQQQNNHNSSLQIFQAQFQSNMY